MKKLTNEFTGKNILFTGDMHLINEKHMYWLLCEMADAIHKSSVSKKIDFVVVGAKAGPAKLKQVEELNNQGCNILVIDEETFIRKFLELEELPPYINFYY